MAGRVRDRRGVPLKKNGPLTTGPRIRRAFHALMRRSDARAAATVARPEDAVRAVGGAVRDAFLGRRGGDLDLVVPKGRGGPFAMKLAEQARTRVIPVGAAPRGVLKVPFLAGEIDVWEEDGDAAADLLRRDFTVNALAFSLLGGAFTSAPGALADLAARKLVPPRPGVFLEDPLRVLRAARFLAELPGFQVAHRAMPELREAARFLRMVSGERVLAEMDRLLSAPSPDASRALRFLDRIGALEILLQGTAPRERRRGLLLVGKLNVKTPSPRVARALLLLPVGSDRAVDFLRVWKTTREEQRLASLLFSLPLHAPRGSRGLRAGRREPTRRDIAAFLRLSSPFEEESTAFLLAAGNTRAKELAHASQRVLRRPASLRRILKPIRPLPFAEISSLLRLPEGPALGRVLAAFDLALASGEVRGARAARAWLERPPRDRIPFGRSVT